MVLWEITVATAYFLGLKKTYRLALKMQRRVVSPSKHPKISNFLRRKTRVAFDIALSVHQKIQKRDLEVGRSFGNWILRWLDRAKPSAQICTSPPAVPPRRNTTKHDIINMSRVPQSQIQNIKAKTKTKTKSSDSARRLFSTPWSIRPKGFPNIAMMMQPPKSITADNQYRQQYNYNSITLCTENMCRIRASQNVFRKDIAMLIHQSLK